LTLVFCKRIIKAMNKIFFKNILVFILFVLGFFVSAGVALAEIPGRYLTADVSATDLLDIVSKYPKTFWSLAIIFVIAVVVYSVRSFMKKK